MVVRDDCGNILDTAKTSVTQLYEHHIYAIDRIRKATVRKEFAVGQLQNIDEHFI